MMSEIQESQDLPRPEVSLAEKIHEQQVKMLNAQYPELDPLMCSVLLKCPPELMEELKKDPAMWVTPQASTHVLYGNVTVSDPEPTPEPESQYERSDSVDAELDN